LFSIWRPNVVAAGDCVALCVSVAVMAAQGGEPP
jgi:hypothetical protein